jgi:hypothetical protein
MKLQFKNYSTKFQKGWIYLFLVIFGILIILLCSLFQRVPAPTMGEYYYSTFFRNNYTLIAKALFFISGLTVGYFYKLNPWYAGICLNLIFPLTSIIEASVYKGTHNLIPFEFAFHFLFSLPAVIAIYIGRFVYSQVTSRKERIEKNVSN